MNKRIHAELSQDTGETMTLKYTYTHTLTHEDIYISYYYYVHSTIETIPDIWWTVLPRVCRVILREAFQTFCG